VDFIPRLRMHIAFLSSSLVLMRALYGARRIPLRLW
jgi:hypothetical protein